MPYYAWQGVDLQARWRKGKLYARNTAELDTILFKKDIALFYAEPKRLRSSKISQQEVLHYIIQLHTLINAGVRIPEALNIIAAYPMSAYFSSIVYDIADQVAQGINLAVTLAKYPAAFNGIAVQVVHIGQESGSLPQSLQVLIHHLESVLDFKKKLRAAFLLPAITFIFFILIIAIVLIMIVPQFVSLCATMGKQLPASTQMLLNISNFLRSYNVLIICAGFSLSLFAVARNIKNTYSITKISRFLLRIPLIKQLIVCRTMALFFRSSAHLLQGGLPLAKALAISAESIENSFLKDHLRYVARSVDSGMALSESLNVCSDYLDQGVIALVGVGQESGKLADLLIRIADGYQEKLLMQMHRITTSAQPFLLIILGVLIGMLILGLYAPIMNLSSIF